MSFGRRLLKVREYLGISQREMAKLIGVSERVYLDYEKEKKKPTYEKLLPLASKGINLHWLLTGEGEMFINNETKGTAEVERNISVPSPIDRELFQRITELIEGYYKAGLLKGVSEEEIIEMVKFLYKKVKPIKDSEEADWRDELNKLGKNYAKIFLT